MRCRLVPAILVLVAACGSKSTDRRDAALPPADSSPGKDGNTDLALPDGPVPDAPLAMDTSGRDTPSVELARDTALPDLATGPDSTQDQGAVRDLGPVETAGAKDVAVESARDSAGTFGDLGLAAAICTGNSVRSVVNGATGAPAVRATPIAMGCCDGIELQLVSATFVSEIYVSVLIPATGNPLPTEVDLTNLPKDWRFLVSTDCDSTGSSCKEEYSSGYIGTLQLARMDGGHGIDLSLCMHVEDVDGTHSKLRTLDLYIPHATVN
jgi:hypothetical protein